MIIFRAEYLPFYALRGFNIEVVLMWGFTVSCMVSWSKVVSSCLHHACSSKCIIDSSCLLEEEPCSAQNTGPPLKRSLSTGTNSPPPPPPPKQLSLLGPPTCTSCKHVPWNYPSTETSCLQTPLLSAKGAVSHKGGSLYSVKVFVYAGLAWWLFISSFL